jgi:hypothetical protein
VGAIEAVATRVPVDVTTSLRDDPSDPEGVDARAFIERIQPACGLEGATGCWSAPPGVEHEQAVASYDEARFLGVVPGTRLTFQVRLRNEVHRGEVRSQVFVAFVDVRGSGRTVLETRQVFVVVPADDTLL